MTSDQRKKLLGVWWPNACKAQGWNRNDRDFRLSKLGEFVGRPIESTNELGSEDDIDIIKSELGRLSDNLAATVETDQKHLGQRRRLLWKHYTIQRPCLAIYVADVDAYLKQLLRERFKIITGLNSIEDLNAEPIPTRIYGGREILKPSKLLQFIITIDGRLSLFRRKQIPTHSEHAMFILAGLKHLCECKACKDERAATPKVKRPRRPKAVPRGDADETNLVAAGHDQTNDNQPF